MDSAEQNHKTHRTLIRESCLRIVGPILVWKHNCAAEIIKYRPSFKKFCLNFLEDPKEDARNPRILCYGAVHKGCPHSGGGGLMNTF